jgi:hypothetical protein
MNIKLMLGLLAVSLAACSGNQQNSLPGMTENKATIDTIVGSKTITDEIAGSAFRKRAIGYFVITGQDTSDYTCIFTESKDGGEVMIDLNVPYLKAEMSYRERLGELKIILTKAAADFNYDSLTSIYLGRLVLSGDLAVEVTKEYREKFGAGDKPASYIAVGQFLKESRLGVDLDNLLKPYSISVDKVSIEKLFFTTRSDLYWASKIEADSIDVPDKILDCMTWIKLIRN